MSARFLEDRSSSDPGFVRYWCSNCKKWKFAPTNYCGNCGEKINEVVKVLFGKSAYPEDQGGKISRNKKSKKDKLQDLEVLFKECRETTRANIKAHHALTEAEEKYYGFNHADRDMDDIIDVVDFDAGGTMSFSQFHKRMMQEKNNSGS